MDFVPEGYRVTGVTIQAGYWRKANAIHQWFVDNVQEGIDDCRNSSVSRDQLQTLLDICKQIIAAPGRAEELLPTTNGFFFGGTEYDEWYFTNLQKTVDQIEAVLEKFSEQAWTISYQSSW